MAPANQTKERSVHELFARAFRNKSSRCEKSACFPKENHQNSQKLAKFMNFSFWPFLWFGLPGRLLILLTSIKPGVEVTCTSLPPLPPGKYWPHLDPVALNSVIRMSCLGPFFLSEAFRGISEQFRARSAYNPFFLKCRMGVRGNTPGTTPGRSNSPKIDSRPTGSSMTGFRCPEKCPKKRKPLCFCGLTTEKEDSDKTAKLCDCSHALSEG